MRDPVHEDALKAFGKSDDMAVNRAKLRSLITASKKHLFETYCTSARTSAMAPAILKLI